MVSRSLIQMIEDHCDSITARIVRELREDPLLPQMGTLPESELRDRTREVVKNLGHWLVPGQESEIARRYELLGRRRHEESIPLQEVVRALHTSRTTFWIMSANRVSAGPLCSCMPKNNWNSG